MSDKFILFSFITLYTTTMLYLVVGSLPLRRIKLAYQRKKQLFYRSSP